MSTVSTLVVALTAQTTDFERGLKSVERSLDRTAARIADLGESMSAGLTLPIAALATAATKLAVDFSEPFDSIGAIMGESRGQIEQMRGAVLQLSGATAQSPVELAKALLGIEQAGFRGKDALEVLRVAAEGNAVGLASMGSITGLVTAAMNAYGPGVLSAAQATSVLLTAVREGRVGGDALAGSLGGILPLAAQARLSFDQITAAVTAMTRMGLEAGQATMGLRSVLQTILKPSTDAQHALSEIGLNAGKLRTELQTQGLLAVLQTLAKAFQGNEEAITRVFPNARALSGVLSLLGANSKEVSGIFRDMAATTSEGLGKAFGDVASGPGFKMRQALVAIQESLIRLGDDLLPVVVPLVERFTITVDQLSARFQALDGGTRDLVIVAAALVAGIGPALLLFSSFYSAAGTAVGVLRLLVGVVTSLAATALPPLLTAVSAAIAGIVDLELAVIGFVTTLSGPFLVAVALMAFAAALIYDRWAELKTDLGIIFDWIVEQARDSFAGKIIAYIQQFASYAADVLARFGIKIKESVRAGFEEAKSAAVTAVDAMKDRVTSGLSGALDAAKKLATQILGTVKSVGGTVPGPGKGGAPGLPAPAVTPPDTSAWTSFTQTVTGAFKTIQQASRDFVAAFQSDAASISAGARSIASQGAASMGTLAAAFVKGKISAAEFVSDMIRQIEMLIVKILIFRAVAGAFGVPFAGAFVSGLGMHSEGGRPAVGQMSIVGEKGPELFVPDTAGTIIPNSALQGGGGQAITVHNEVTVQGLDLSSAPAAAQIIKGLKEQLTSATSDAIQFATRTSQVAAASGGRAA